MSYKPGLYGKNNNPQFKLPYKKNYVRRRGGFLQSSSEAKASTTTGHSCVECGKRLAELERRVDYLEKEVKEVIATFLEEMEENESDKSASLGSSDSSEDEMPVIKKQGGGDVEPGTFKEDPNNPLRRSNAQVGNFHF